MEAWSRAQVYGSNSSVTDTDDMTRGVGGLAGWTEIAALEPHASADGGWHGGFLFGVQPSACYTEFVVLPAGTTLASRAADPTSFQSRFGRTKSARALSFDKFWQSGTWCQVGSASASKKWWFHTLSHYGHLAVFLRGVSNGFVPLEQGIAVWSKLSQAIKKELRSHDTVWISTDGRGFPWLHLRIDQTPKYFKSNLRLGSWGCQLASDKVIANEALRRPKAFVICFQPAIRLAAYCQPAIRLLRFWRSGFPAQMDTSLQPYSNNPKWLGLEAWSEASSISCIHVCLEWFHRWRVNGVSVCVGSIALFMPVCREWHEVLSRHVCHACSLRCTEVGSLLPACN